MSETYRSGKLKRDTELTRRKSCDKQRLHSALRCLVLADSWCVNVWDKGPLIPLASWLIGISPVSLPIYASATLLSLAELPEQAARAVPRAFHFGLLVAVLVAGWLVTRLWAARQAMARTILAAPAESVMRQK